MESCGVVIPGRSYNNVKAITPHDTTNNLLSGDVSLAYIQNAGATAIDVTIATRTSSTNYLARLAEGQFLQLPPQALRVMSTGTTGGATIKGYW